MYLTGWMARACEVPPYYHASHSLNATEPNETSARFITIMQTALVYEPRHPQPFTFAQAMQFDISVLTKGTKNFPYQY